MSYSEASTEEVVVSVVGGDGKDGNRKDGDC